MRGVPPPLCARQWLWSLVIPRKERGHYGKSAASVRFYFFFFLSFTKQSLTNISSAGVWSEVTSNQHSYNKRQTVEVSASAKALKVCELYAFPFVKDQFVKLVFVK